MGNPAGVPRDFEALEKRRFQAIQMLERGLRQAEIARQLRVVPQTVARWMHDYRTHGKSALRKAGRAGRKPRLSEKQRQQLARKIHDFRNTEGLAMVQIRCLGRFEAKNEAFA